MTEPQSGEPTAGRELTKGEFRVGINFNPSNSSEVDAIKQAAAFFIDMVDKVDGSGGDPVSNEIQRLKALAQTHIEDAAMWAVKAATKRK